MAYRRNARCNTAKCGRFPSSTFAGSAIMLAICFRLPLTEPRWWDCTLYFITAPSSLFQRPTDGQMIGLLWQYITQTDYRVIAIYKTAPCGTFSQLPWTWTRCEVTATERYMSCDRSVSRQSLRVASRAVHSADTAVAYVFTHRCTWRRRNESVENASTDIGMSAVCVLLC